MFAFAVLIHTKSEDSSDSDSDSDSTSVASVTSVNHTPSSFYYLPVGQRDVK